MSPRWTRVFNTYAQEHEEHTEMLNIILPIPGPWHLKSEKTNKVAFTKDKGAQ